VIEVISSRQLWSAVTDHLWQSSVVILVLWALARMLARAPARYQTAVWWLAIGKLLVPVGLLAMVLGRLESAVVAGEPLSRLGQAVATLPGFRISDSVPGLRGSGWQYLLVFVIWAAGAIAVPLVGWFRTRGSRSSAGAAMPRVVGVWRPKVVVPDIVRGALSSDELAAVRLHERIHCRRRDPQKGLLVLLTGSLFWFFPLAWLVIHRLRAATELACDEEVVAAGVCPETYATALARTISLGLVPAPAGTHLARSRGSVAERLDRIRHPGRFIAMRRYDWIRVMALALLLVSLVPALSVALAQQISREELLERMGPGHDLLLRLRGVEQRVSLTAEAEPLRRILRRLGHRGGFEVAVRGVGADHQVDLELRNVTVGEALATLARDHGLEYGVSDDGGVLSVSVLMRPGGRMSSPERIHYVSPHYPKQARDLGIEGVVIMEATVDVEGRVSDVQVLRGIHPLLDKAAVEAAMQWLYTPTLYKGEPVEVLLTVTVQFQIQSR